MAKLTDIMFVDIETVSQYNTWDEVPAQFKRLWAKQIKQSYRDFLPVPPGTSVAPEDIHQNVLVDLYNKKAALHAEFSKVVCCSVGKFVMENGDDKPPTLKVKSIIGDELAILTTFANASTKATALCAHNGKKFDFPFLARRAVINGLPVPKILDVRDQKPWEVANIDTQELWRFGDMVYPSLELMCAVLGLEGKDDLDGSQIHGAFYKGEIQSIASHCSQDVVALAKLYVKLAYGLTVENVMVL